jgi:hypothetical protein
MAIPLPIPGIGGYQLYPSSWQGIEFLAMKKKREVHKFQRYEEDDRHFGLRLIHQNDCDLLPMALFLRLTMLRINIENHGRGMDAY